MKGIITMKNYEQLIRSEEFVNLLTLPFDDELDTYTREDIIQMITKAYAALERFEGLGE